jgi:hypothetical protein
MGTKKIAYSYYQANIRLCQASWPLLHIIEVASRNSIYNALSDYYDDSDWILNEINKSLKGNKIEKDVQEIIQAINEKGKEPTSDRIVSELSFGFWRDIFNASYEKIWKEAPLHAFPHKLPNYRVLNAYRDLSKIKDFRNRVSHHDSLFIVQEKLKTGNKNKLHWKGPESVRVEILKLLSFINPELKYIASKEHDKMKDVIEEIKLIGNPVKEETEGD